MTDKPLISSVRLVPGPTHDIISVWNRGGLAGSLTVNAGDGALLKELLLVQGSTADFTQPPPLNTHLEPSNEPANSPVDTGHRDRGLPEQLPIRPAAVTEDVPAYCPHHYGPGTTTEWRWRCVCCHADPDGDRGTVAVDLVPTSRTAKLLRYAEASLQFRALAAESLDHPGLDAALTSREEALKDLSREVAGNCDRCKGPVYHREGSPGEWDHACYPAQDQKPLRVRVRDWLGFIDPMILGKLRTYMARELPAGTVIADGGSHANWVWRWLKAELLRQADEL